ncbi:hypothetical protein E2C01_010776 [Portunus trituberculatus]|uniref:Uncharacterized protein n=1 Tax=Portunus trituberculatus TaxID=210409 RepID=A0A5B7D9T2_PORTR|nr:hypothetical protein [Portunus trituberculatus]
MCSPGREAREARRPGICAAHLGCSCSPSGPRPPSHSSGAVLPSVGGGGNPGHQHTVKRRHLQHQHAVPALPGAPGPQRGCPTCACHALSGGALLT